MLAGIITRREIQAVQFKFTEQTLHAVCESYRTGNRKIQKALHVYFQCITHGFELFSHKPRMFYVVKNTAEEISNNYQQIIHAIGGTIDESRKKSIKYEPAKRVQGDQNALASSFYWLMCENHVGPRFRKAFPIPPGICRIRTSPDREIEFY